MVSFDRPGERFVQLFQFKSHPNSFITAKGFHFWKHPVMPPQYAKPDRWVSEVLSKLTFVKRNSPQETKVNLTKLRPKPKTE